MDIQTIEVAGVKAVLIALRRPFKKDVRSMIHSSQDAKLELMNDPELFGVYTSDSYLIHVDSKDITLLQRLIKNGDEEAKVVRGLMAYASINAPRYFWQEMDTYRIGTDRLSSESTMHVEAKGFTGEELQKVKGDLKESHHQRRDQVYSYQTLRRIYRQRKTHRLPEWHIFHDWIRSLPFSETLITVDL